MRRGRLVAIAAAVLALAVLAYGVYQFLAPQDRGLADLRTPDPAKVVQVPTSPSPIIPDELLVMLEGGKSVSEFRGSLGDLKAKIVGSVPRLGIVQIEVPPADREAVKSALEKNPIVRAVVYQVLFEPSAKFNDPVFTNDNPLDDWNLRAIRAEKAWDLAKGSRKTVIAVVDGGVLVDHEEVKGKIVSPVSIFTRSEKQKGGARWLLHGTHVAITAAGQGNNGRGTSGVCPDCAIMPVQVMGEEGQSFLTNIINGVYYAVLNGAKVINLSLGVKLNEDKLRLFRDPRTRKASLLSLAKSLRKTLPVFDRVFRAAEDAGATVVVAAGNDNIPGDLNPICASRHTLCVGAVGLTRQGKLGPAKFSNWGYPVQVSAPGVGIYSGSAEPGAGSYQVLKGTSMAAPHVAGLAGLIASRRPDLPPRFIRRAILESVISDVPSAGFRFRQFIRKDAANSVKLRRWVQAFYLLAGLKDDPRKISTRLMEILYTLVPEEYVKDWYDFEVLTPRGGVTVGGKPVGGFVDAEKALRIATDAGFRKGAVELDEEQLRIARRVKREDLVRVYEMLGLARAYPGSSREGSPEARVGPFRLELKPPYQRLTVVRKKDPGKGYAEWLEYVSPGRYRHAARYGGKDLSQGVVEVRRADDRLSLKDPGRDRPALYGKEARGGGVTRGLGSLFAVMEGLPRRGYDVYLAPPFCTIALRCEGAAFRFRARAVVAGQSYPIEVDVALYRGKKAAARGRYGSAFDFLLPAGAYRVRVEDAYSGGGREEFEVVLAEGRAVEKEVRYPKGFLAIVSVSGGGKPLATHRAVYAGKKRVAKQINTAKGGFFLSAGAYQVEVWDSKVKSVSARFDATVEEGKVTGRKVRLARGSLILRTRMAADKPMKTALSIYSGTRRVFNSYGRDKYQVALPPGAYRLVAAGDKAGLVKKQLEFRVEEGKALERDLIIAAGRLHLRTFYAEGKPLESHFHVFSGKEKIAQTLFSRSAKYLLSPGEYRVRIEDNSDHKEVRELAVKIEEGKTVSREVKIPKGSLKLRTFYAEGKPLESHFYVFSGGKKIAQTLFARKAGFLLGPGEYRVRIEDKSHHKDTRELALRVEEGKTVSREVKIPKGHLRLSAVDGSGKPVGAHFYVLGAKKPVSQVLFKSKAEFLLRPQAYPVRVVKVKDKKVKTEFSVTVEAGKTAERKVTLP